MVQLNAEVLSGLVALESASPGCPLIYVGNAAIMDMRAATYAQGGAETALLDTGLVELGRRYGVPTFTIGFYTDDKTLSVHAGIDMMTMAMNSFLVKPDIISGPGLLDSAMLLNLPKLVLDAEMRRICDRMMQGVTVDDEYLMGDLIAAVGPGGQYLKAKETRTVPAGRRALEPGGRSRVPPTRSGRPIRRRQSTGRPTRWSGSSASHTPMPLPDPEAIEAVIARADREIGDE